MVSRNAIRSHIPGVRNRGTENNTVNANIAHGAAHGPQPGNNPPHRVRHFLNTVFRRHQHPPAPPGPAQNQPQTFLTVQAFTDADLSLPGIDGNTIHQEASDRIARRYADREQAIFGGLAKTEDIEKATTKLGPRQVKPVPVYRPDIAKLIAQLDTARSGKAGSSQQAALDKPLGHLPERSYNQVMQILGQSGNASSLDIPALKVNLDKEIAGLEAFKEQVSQHLKDGKQPGNAISKNDARYARHVIAMYNAENEGLNAEVFNSPPDLVKYIKENIGDFGRLRALFRMGSTAEILHHSAADIRVKDGKVTIVCADPANLSEPNIVRSVMAMDDALEALSPIEQGTAYVGVGTQNSPNDCVAFSESFLKKMDDEETFFNKLHDKLYNGQALNEEPHIQPRKPELAEAMAIADEMLRDLENISQLTPDARHFFPLVFYKHSHSLKDVEELLARQPENSQAKVNQTR